VIKQSSGYYFSMAGLFGLVGAGMMLAAYWSFELREITHVVFSMCMAGLGIWFSLICIGRGKLLRANRRQAEGERTKSAGLDR